MITNFSGASQRQEVMGERVMEVIWIIKYILSAHLVLLNILTAGYCLAFFFFLFNIYKMRDWASPKRLDTKSCRSYIHIWS